MDFNREKERCMKDVLGRAQQENGPSKKFLCADRAAVRRILEPVVYTDLSPHPCQKSCSYLISRTFEFVEAQKYTPAESKNTQEHPGNNEEDEEHKD
ncbi:hypothetical protein DICVIV_10627 [Dictyocaulus viviparus]|uniref:Uncharacterized protein n=1 Tax=Dictyocaulus viviparus TaxID=29172 RepID=A0A0D8XHW3_DICVI|nr:hypothetical protein DICVIV_10627 [Dictyocaulus viviparus]